MSKYANQRKALLLQRAALELNKKKIKNHSFTTHLTLKK